MGKHTSLIETFFVKNVLFLFLFFHGQQGDNESLGAIIGSEVVTYQLTHKPTDCLVTRLIFQVLI